MEVLVSLLIIGVSLMLGFGIGIMFMDITKNINSQKRSFDDDFFDMYQAGMRAVD